MQLRDCELLQLTLRNETATLICGLRPVRDADDARELREAHPQAVYWSAAGGWQMLPAALPEPPAATVAAAKRRGA